MDKELVKLLKSKKCLFLIIIVILLMYLDLINFRTINDNDKFILDDLIGVKLYKLNIDMWISLFSIPLAVIGTYIVTSYHYNIQKEDQENQWEREKEVQENQWKREKEIQENQWKREKEVQLRASYKVMNKGNADAIITAIKKFYEINHYIDLLWIYYFNFDGNVDITNIIKFHYKEQLRFLQMLEEDFFYQSDLIEEIQFAIQMIECKKNEIDTESIQCDSYLQMGIDMFEKYFVQDEGYDMDLWFKFLAYVTRRESNKKFNYFLDNPANENEEAIDHILESIGNYHILLGGEIYEGKEKDSSQYLIDNKNQIRLNNDFYIRIRYI